MVYAYAVIAFVGWVLAIGVAAKLGFVCDTLREREAKIKTLNLYLTNAIRQSLCEHAHVSSRQGLALYCDDCGCDVLADAGYIRLKLYQPAPEASDGHVTI